MSESEYFAANRTLWDKRTPIHLASKFYDVAGFKQGKSSLCGLEQEALGDFQGRSLLHLQCHFGQDTLSLARLGARVTGVDFSQVAIDAARQLAGELELPAQFVCANIFDLPEVLDERFDIVFTSFGVLGWLPDLGRWAQVISHFLRPGGVFYMLEFHPFYSQFDDEGKILFDYFPIRGPTEDVCTETYTDGGPHEPQQEYWFCHPLSEILTALLGQGLKIEQFREYPFSVYNLGTGMQEIEPGKWVNRQLGKRIPYLFSIQASLPV